MQQIHLKLHHLQRVLQQIPVLLIHPFHPVHGLFQPVVQVLQLFLFLRMLIHHRDQIPQLDIRLKICYFRDIRHGAHPFFFQLLDARYDHLLRFRNAV